MEERKKGKSQNKRGRKKRVEITDEVIKQVEFLSGRGLTEYQIAAYFGISDVTFQTYKNDNPKLMETLRKGKSKTISFVSGQLIEQIRRGSTSATIFYLKCQAGWKDPNAASNKKNDDESDESNEPKDLKTGTSDPNEASKIYQQIMLGE